MRQPDIRQQSINLSDEAANNQAVAQRQASKSITISSSEPLEITFTSTGMEVSVQCRYKILEI